MRLAILASVLALVFPAAAAAKVQLVSITSPVKPGAKATLVVAVSPAQPCTIAVVYKSGPSKAQGLGVKRPSAGRVSWTWTVGARTTPGSWPVHVKCGKAGALKAMLVVRK